MSYPFLDYSSIFGLANVFVACDYAEASQKYALHPEWQIPVVIAGQSKLVTTVRVNAISHDFMMICLNHLMHCLIASCSPHLTSTFLPTRTSPAELLPLCSTSSGSWLAYVALLLAQKGKSLSQLLKEQGQTLHQLTPLTR